MNISRDREIVTTIRMTGDEYEVINVFLELTQMNENTWNELEEWAISAPDGFNISVGTAREIVKKFIRDF